jgi:hypothetical protein
MFVLSFSSGTGFQPVKPTGWKPVPPRLPREAALFLCRPERKRRNSHTETLHGVYPELRRKVQGGRKRPSRSFCSPRHCLRDSSRAPDTRAEMTSRNRTGIEAASQYSASVNKLPSPRRQLQLVLRQVRVNE